MTKNRAFLLFMLSLIFLFPSACRNERIPSLEELRLPAEDIVECRLLPVEGLHLNGGSTTDREKLAKITEYFNRFLCHICTNEKEHEQVIGDGGCTVVFVCEDGTELPLSFGARGVIRRYDGVLLDIVSEPPGPTPAWFLSEILGISRFAGMERVQVPEEDAVRFEYVGPEAPEGAVVTEPKRLRLALSSLNGQDYYPCRGYKSEFPEPQSYYTITYADGTIIRYDVAAFFIRTPDGDWFENISPAYQVYEVVLRCQDLIEAFPACSSAE